MHQYFVDTIGNINHIQATNQINIDNPNFKQELLNKIKILLPLQKQLIIHNNVGIMINRHNVGIMINRHIDVLTRVAFAISYNDPNQNDIDNYRDLIVFLNIILFDVPQVNQMRNIDANINPDNFRKELNNTVHKINGIDVNNIPEDMRQQFQDIKTYFEKLNDKIQQENDGPSEDQ